MPDAGALVVEAASLRGGPRWSGLAFMALSGGSLQVRRVASKAGDEAFLITNGALGRSTICGAFRLATSAALICISAGPPIQW
jgi:hypothetical protein